MNASKILRCLKRYLLDPSYRFGINTYLGINRYLSDEEFSKREYYYVTQKQLNLEHPTSFNEKLQWLKIYDHNPIYTQMVDKLAAKEYVRSIIGDEYIIPTLAIWDSIPDIDISQMPEQFVIKTTHDSGGLVICRNKELFDETAALKKISKSLRRNYYMEHREWPYKNVPKRIFAERYLQDSSNGGLRDYKFYCFSGEPQFLYLSQGLENHATANISFLTLDWKIADFGRSDFEPFEILPNKPDNFGEMIDIARQLSQDMSFLRVDLYNVNGHIYFSELTFCPCAGMMVFVPDEADYQIGQYLNLFKKE